MKRVINEGDIDRLAKNGVLAVDRDMLLTPSAREYASRKGIRLDYDTTTHRSSDALDASQLDRIIEDVLQKELGQKNLSHLAMPPAPASQPAQQEECTSYFKQSSAPPATAPRAVVSLAGLNRPGIVARISGAIAELGGNLAGMNQVILDDYFSLIFIVDLESTPDGLSFRLFRERMQDIAANLGQMEVMVMNEEVFQAMHRV